MTKGDVDFNFENYKTIFGVEIANESLSYAKKRDELDKKNFASNKETVKRPEVSLRRFEVSSDIVKIDFGDCTLDISPVSENLLHFVWSQKGESTPKYRRDLNDRFTPESVHFRVEYAKDEIYLDAGIVGIRICNNGSIKYEFTGEIIRTDLPPLISNRSLVHESLIRRKSKLYGTGERALPFDLRGNRVILWNHDPNGSYGPGVDPIYISIPQIIDLDGARGYGIEYMNPSKGLIDLCKKEEDLLRVEFRSGQLDYYITFGNMQEILERLANVTGLPMLPPRWSFGFHQSKYSYMDAKQIEDVVTKFHRLNLPISAVHMDIDYMKGYRVFTTNKNSFPDIKGLSDRLMRKGIRLVSILDPAVKWDEDYAVFKELVMNSGYVRDPEGNPIAAPVWAGKSVFPDYSSEETQRWWSSLYSFFEDNGISGVWHDMNEPVAFALWGDNSLPLSAVHEKGSHSEIHNLYALYMAKAGYEGLTKNANGLRPFLLSRSGWSGIQRYSFVWTGDTESTWQELKQTVPTILNLSLSGIPYTGVDIGGFSGTPTRNLFIRWFQLGAFLPLFRVHSAKGTGDRELWSYGEEVLDILRRFIELRYSLIPYWYSVAFDSHQTGHPLIRPISYHYPQMFDGYSFMVGESILVYPVLDENVRKMRIKLPPGKWYSLWDSSVKKGTVEEDLDESRIPVYVREGSVIPREDGKLHFDVYPGGNFSFTHYMDDDGLVPVFRTIRFNGRSDGDTFSLEYEQSGDMKDNETVILILKNRDCVFKENNSQEISVSQRKGKVEVAHKSQK